MDKTSRAIIKAIRETDEPHILHLFDMPQELLDEFGEDELRRSAGYLVGLGYLEYVCNQDDIPLGIAATHRALHPVALSPFFTWLFHDYLGGVVIGVTSTLLAEILALVLHLLLAGQVPGLSP